MYSTLMVHLELEKDNTPLLDIAGDLAERFDADVIGITACQPLSIVAGDGVLTGEVFEMDRTNKTDQMKVMEKSFRTALQHRVRGLEWRSQLDYEPPIRYIVEEMRSADLLITGVKSHGSWLDSTWNVNTTDLIMQTGRPVLVVPKHIQKLVADNILIGWKNSRESRRAVSDALPFLSTAKRVVVTEVVTSASGLADARKNTQDVCAWLERHDIPAEPLVTVNDESYIVPLDDIAQKQGADLVVIGAYGHSRLHEWMLGGVTRDLLMNAERCSLLSH